jgi:hypothetical protein
MSLICSMLRAVEKSCPPSLSSSSLSLLSVYEFMSGVIAKLVIGGPDQFSCQILKFLAGSLAMSGQKKSIPNPNFMPKQESPTLTPIPPLAKIWHQLYHGGDSISSNMVLTKKRLCQRITYPLGSTLIGGGFFLCVVFNAKQCFLS